MSDSYIANLGYQVDTSPLKKGEQALDKMTVAGDKTEAGMGRVSASIGILSAGIAALAANTLITDVIDYSSAWTKVDNQLRIVIDSESELISKRKELIELSKETNAGLNSTVSLYAELRRNTEEIGTADADLMTVTRTLNNLFIAGAKGAETQASAITMLNRGLAEGVLRGEDYNSVVDAAPRIMEAIARTTGIATGEVRAFAATGGITSEILIDALTSYSTEAQRLADATTKTFDQSTENAKTNVLAYVGAAQSIQDATLSLGESIEYASENIDAIVNGIITATAVTSAYALVMGGKAVASATAMVAAKVALIKSEATLTATTLANTQSEVARLAISKQSHTDAILRVKSETIRDTIRKQLTLTTVELAAAESRLATAQTAASVAGARATTSAIALTGATTVLGTAVNFLLGPWGLLLGAIAAAGIAYSLTDDEASDFNNTLDIQSGLLDDVTEKVRLLSEYQKANVALEAKFKLNDNKQKQRELEAQILADSFSSSAVASLTLKKQEQLNDLKSEEARLVSVIAAANEKPDKAKSPIANDKLATQISNIQKMTEQLSMTENERFVDSQVRAALARGDSEAQIELIRQEAQAYISAKKAKEDFTDLISGTDTVDLFSLNESTDYDSWISGIEEAMNKAQMLETEMGDVWEAMLGGDIDWDAGIKKIAELQDEIDSLEPPKDIGFDIIANGATDSLRAMQSLSAQGSKEYRKLGVAIEAVNAIQAISAVLNQAAGDPYTAFARMAAMAASVASLGYSVGSLSGGGFDDLAAGRQEVQGTTIWGDKSESIADSIDMIASASDKLVGINTGMLKALTTVQNGITKAASLVGRDITTPTANVSVKENLFDGFQNIFSGDILDLTGNILGDTFTELLNMPLNFIGKWLGGSSKVVDQGIMIMGGKLGEMIDDIAVQSYQTVQYKKWKFGSKKSKTAYNDITDDVGAQFQLVLDSIADSVFQGATMLGLGAGEVEKAIQDFEIETIRISLKGLSAEDQQEEIEAVFSSIFDDLAGGVVPFLEDFQEVGEGLGETLARVATQVNIMDLIVDQLGVTMFDKFSDPEMYAAAAENISDLVGGVESFAEKVSGFVDNFATDAVKLGIYQDSLTESLAEVGLALPGTSAGMWELMQSLDGSTEAGQEQIAMLLNSQEQSAAYYDMLEKITGRYRDAIDAMYDVSEAVAAMTLDAALSAARMGDLSLADDLDVDALAPDIDNYKSKLEYDLARADTAAKLEELAKITEGTISVDEKQLTTLEEIRDSLKDGVTEEYNAEVSEIKREVTTMNEVQKAQARNIADSNAILQQMLTDGIPVRIEE